MKADDSVGNGAGAIRRDILRKILITGLMLAASTVFSLLLEEMGVGKESIIMVFLLGTLFTTVFTGGYVYGVTASVICVFIFNYCFAEPQYSFIIHSASDVILMAFFEATAIVTGTVMSKLYRQRELAEQNACTARILQNVAASFMNVTGGENILAHGANLIVQYTGFACSVELDAGQRYCAGVHEETVADRAYALKSTSGQIGNMRIFSQGASVTPQNELVFKTVAAQIGLALDRERIYAEREEIRVSMEGERLRATLLRAVAHDLRSPLTALSGASTLLADDFDRLSSEEKKKLAQDISEELIWLSNLVENILNMTRINDGKLALRMEEEVVDDVVGEVVGHMKRLLGARTLSISLPDEVLTLPMDGKLIVQVLVNLIDNAIRHTSPDGKIELSVRRQQEMMCFSVANDGEDIDPEIEDTLFEGFVTSRRGVGDMTRGIGLGLAISKAIVEAHRGKIQAERNAPHGARFTFWLPLEGL